MTSLKTKFRTALIGAGFVAGFSVSGFSGAALAQDQAPKKLEGPQRVVTVKCDQLNGHIARYGSLTDFLTGEETLPQGKVDWLNKDYEGAAPTIVLTDHAQGRVLVDIEMRNSTFQKRGVNKQELITMLSDKTMHGMPVNGNMQQDSMFVQFMRTLNGKGGNRGTELFSIDSKTKTLILTMADHYDDFSDKRHVTGWLFISKCEWFENQIALD